MSKRNRKLLLATKLVVEVDSIKLVGNITPISWYKSITMKNGKPDIIAITLLADLWQWYTAKHEREEETNTELPLQRYFADDKLQRSYDQWADEFGFSKEQVRDATHKLVDLGLIELEFRNKIISGVKVNNIMYPSPVVPKIMEITFYVPPPGSKKAIEKQRVDTYRDESVQGVVQKCTGIGTEVDTNTCITSCETTCKLEDSTESSCANAPQPVGQASLFGSESTGKKKNSNIPFKVKEEESAAVELAHTILNYKLNNIQKQAINKTVTDIPKWIEVLTTRKLRGLTPTKIDEILYWYKNGIPPMNQYKNKVGTSVQSVPPKELRNSDGLTYNDFLAQQLSGKIDRHAEWHAGG